MLNFTQDDLQLTAERIMAMDLDPVPRFRLLRDVLHLERTDAAYRAAENALQHSKWVALLANTQQADGTWGRFHTRDSRLKQPFPTTEMAVQCALDVGLDGNSAMLQRLVPVILSYMDGSAVWPDNAEKHDNPQAWTVWVKHFSAAILALIEPNHPDLNPFWALWAEAMQEAFQSGIYDRQAEIAALNRLMACPMQDPVAFHRRYPLLILSARENRLPGDLERALLAHVMQSPEGIYYVYSKTISDLPPIHSKDFFRWIRAHQLLSRFPTWPELSTQALNWIWAQRTEAGFWDLGRAVARRPYSSFPLSESWRRSQNRVIDSTVEMLGLLAKACEPWRDQPVLGYR